MWENKENNLIEEYGNAFLKALAGKVEKKILAKPDYYEFIFESYWIFHICYAIKADGTSGNKLPGYGRAFIFGKLQEPKISTAKTIAIGRLENKLGERFTE